MRKMKINWVASVVFVAVCLLLVACTGEQLDDCYTNTGPQVTIEREADAFHRIELYNNVNLVVLQGDFFQIKVEGGKNLLSAIKTEVIDSALVIRNTMKCNWMRSYNREITVYATLPALREIRYEGSGDVRNEGQIKLDSLEVNIWGGAGSFNLNLDVESLKLALHYGTADVTVKGRALMTTIYANSYGPFYCSDLISNIVYIRNSGTNECYVYARHILEVEITSVGNIYYSGFLGDPAEIKRNITGSGKLIELP